MDEPVPKTGEWPVDPQEDQPILDERIWIDGCFDFFHHGHAGVMHQARALGTSLLIGIHSDASIAHHKGPTVMTLPERVLAVSACRWATLAIPHAPYVTDLRWISHYGCRYVVHGDDVTSDAGGEDCYRFVKEAGRFRVVKRTKGISTTDLVGRMLVGGKGHFLRGGLAGVVRGEGVGAGEEGQEMRERLKAYASDESGKAPGVDVFLSASGTARDGFERFLQGKQPQAGQRIVYVDGGFDLFSSGHIEFLRSVVEIEDAKARKAGWDKSYSPCYVVAGIHDDEVINEAKGLNYPIMNIYERGLCLLQCKYIHSVVFGAPFTPSSSYLKSLPQGLPAIVYHGPTSFMPHEHDPYVDAKQLGIFEQVPEHAFQHVNAAQIVQRIMAKREEYIERQRRKGEKGIVEAAARRLEMEEAASKSAA